jgi:hypothetical protein
MIGTRFCKHSSSITTSFLNLYFLNFYYSSDFVRKQKRYCMVLDDDNKTVTKTDQR